MFPALIATLHWYQPLTNALIIKARYYEKLSKKNEKHLVTANEYYEGANIVANANKDTPKCYSGIPKAIEEGCRLYDFCLDYLTNKSHLDNVGYNDVKILDDGPKIRKKRKWQPSPLARLYAKGLYPAYEKILNKTDEELYGTSEVKDTIPPRTLRIIRHTSSDDKSAPRTLRIIRRTTPAVELIDTTSPRTLRIIRNMP